MQLDFLLFTLWISPEQDWEPTLEKMLVRDNSTECSTALEKLLLLMDQVDFIKDLEFPLWEFLSTELSISEDTTLEKDGSSETKNLKMRLVSSRDFSLPNLLFLPVRQFHSLWTLLEEN